MLLRAVDSENGWEERQTSYRVNVRDFERDVRAASSAGVGRSPNTTIKEA